ncbi:unnamed protein product [Polarella glacialis]|uniref:Protein phosphatase n=1 Tax=Polarella glacialis TaxID=89957 RepID=A0A813K2X6_POLGL|nr:unnamed protein product [Polarella glacialis]
MFNVVVVVIVAVIIIVVIIVAIVVLVVVFVVVICMMQADKAPAAISTDRAMLRQCETVYVGTKWHKGILETFQRKEQHLSEAYTQRKPFCSSQHKPLCFSAKAFQKTHPVKVKEGSRDADATMVSPMILGVADGVSQIEQYGIDPSLLPRELLRHCESLGVRQLIPDETLARKDFYQGPIALLREAFQATANLGSTTVVLAVLDNSTKIQGKRHPMIAAITVGDCEMLVLRRSRWESQLFEMIFHTEMQRVGGHAQSPLQLARVDDRIDPDFTDAITVEVIERASAVNCVSAYEGDVVIMGSDGVFDNLFLDEIVHLSDSILQPGMGRPLPQEALDHLCRAIVSSSHSKSQRQANGRLPECPIGIGGKVDDTSVVVAEVIEWTEMHKRRYAWLQLVLFIIFIVVSCCCCC